MPVNALAQFGIVEIGDKSVIVKPVEELRSIFITQPVNNNSIINKMFHIFICVDEFVHQNYVRCNFGVAIVIALLEHNQVP